MTVTFTAHVDFRIWRGYDDPGLPVGMWVGQGSVTGDASGGRANVQFIFRDGGSRSGRFYNVEQVEVFHSASTVRPIAMIASNFDRLSAVGLINKQWRAEVDSNGNGVATMTTEKQFPLPVFLGITAVVPEIPSLLVINGANIDLSSFVVTAQGYIWGPRSVMSEGGLRRPVDSLYGGGRQ